MSPSQENWSPSEGNFKPLDKAFSTILHIDIERVVDSQLSASSYTRKPNMLRHACAEFR